MTKRNMIKLGLIYGITALLVACGPKPVKPLKMDPHYQVFDFKQLGILPILDARKDRKVNYEFDKKLKRSIIRLFGKQKAYKLKFEQGYGLHRAINPDDLSSPDPEWVRRLAPDGGARFQLLFVIEDLQSRLTFGSVGSAEVSSYLFDTKEGRLVWFHKGVGKAGQGGLIGMAMKGAMAGMALQGALWRLALAFPKQGEAPVH